MTLPATKKTISDALQMTSDNSAVIPIGEWRVNVHQKLMEKRERLLKKAADLKKATSTLFDSYLFDLIPIELELGELHVQNGKLLGPRQTDEGVQLTEIELTDDGKGWKWAE